MRNVSISIVDDHMLRKVLLDLGAKLQILELARRWCGPFSLEVGQ